MKLTYIKIGQKLHGIDPSGPVEIVQISGLSESSASLLIRLSDGSTRDEMLFQSHEPSLSLVEDDDALTFNGNPAEFQLAAEAQRIKFAHLFDPLMAIHTSDVRPLPHQILAVYDAMLPKQPLRFVLADDPGAGKTIMAGLLIRELMIRGDLERCLIIAPGSLSEQWQTEMDAKFNLSFEIFSRDMIESTTSGNPFAEKNRLIARIDQLSRNEELIEKIEATEWDLVIVDEAHKMSATYFGNEFKATKRYRLGERLGAISRHFLMMTATPHNGKEEDFQAFMALIDSDRFYGKQRQGSRQVGATQDLMRRTLKEEMVKFDGKPLFPERIADTVVYRLSSLEAELYAKVTDYVRNEMDRVKELDGKRRGTVGFALTVLQRRLASSPEAIFQSLQRRVKRLEQMRNEATVLHRGFSEIVGKANTIDAEDLDELEDGLTEEELDELENEVSNQATSAQTIEQLDAEIVILKDLVKLAEQVYRANTDSKWKALRELLKDDTVFVDASGHRRKIIIFTEHKDTLNYLRDQITTLLGTPECIDVLHGGIKREERLKTVERFWNDASLSILLATDAAGEGVNLQVAHLMVNYDLPWNPNRIEQRFGRIHRIGQQEVCRLWNLVAGETREGAVFQRLFDKLDNERQALGDRVFDVLGQTFSDKSLRDLLLEAIQYGEQEEVKARLDQVIDSTLDTDHLRNLLESNALGSTELDPKQVFALRERIEKAEALRLQPLFIEAFFKEAFERLDGSIHEAEPNRYRINHVPSAIRQRDRVLGRKAPVLQSYERICFDKDFINHAGKYRASLIAPGHALMDSTVDLILEQYRNSLKNGSILFDANSDATTPSFLAILEHSIRDGRKNTDGSQRVISQRLQFVLLPAEGDPLNAGPAPHLDFQPANSSQVELAKKWLADNPQSAGIEQGAIDYAASKIVPDHYQEIAERKQRAVDNTRQAVNERLNTEINHLNHRYEQLLVEVQAGRQPRLQPENFRRRAEELAHRLEQRLSELDLERQISAAPPRLLGLALVLPAGMIDSQERGDHSPVADPEARKKSELIGMHAVMEAERALGNSPKDESAQNLGWDITSITPNGSTRFLEVKARQKGATTITVTRNEIAVAFNKKHEGWRLAIVLIDENDQPEGPYYVEAPFDRMPGWAEASVNLDIAKLLKQASPQ